MRFLRFLVFLDAVLLAIGACADEALPKIDAFDLSDLNGREVTPAAWQQYRAVVVVFLGTECPVSNGYAPELRRLYERFRSSDVEFYGVYGEPGITPQSARQHAAEYQIPFTLVIDADQQLAGTIGARRMPEAAVIAPAGQVVYRGRIDNRYLSNGQRRIEATSHDLQAALESVLAGKSPQPNETEAFGCPLPKPKRTKQ